MVGLRFDFKCNYAPLSSFWGFSFAFGCRVLLGGGIQHSPVDGCSAASCDFGVLTGEMSAYPSTLSSCS